MESQFDEADVVIRNAYLVTMDTGRRVFQSGALAVKNGRIIAIGSDRDVEARFTGLQTIDAAGSVVHPGFIDNHNHLCLHNMRWAYPEIPDLPHTPDPRAKSYWDICADEIEYAGSKLASLEMARNGTTCFLEAGTLTTPDAGAKAVEDVGIRGVLGDPFIFDVHEASVPEIERYPLDVQRAFNSLGSELKRNRDPDGLVRGHVNLRGMASASKDLELAAIDLAQEHGVVLNQHQSYHPNDTGSDDQLRGSHPLVYLREIGALRKNCTFAHMNILRDDEIDPIAESSMSVVWCPAASMLHAVGGTFHGRHAELYAQGVNVALGCDSANWTTAFDMAEQMVLAMLTARDKTGQIGLITAEDVLTMATINGAKAVGLQDEIGSLEVGKRADLVIRHDNLPEAQPGMDPIRSFVLSTRSKSIDKVMVNGEVIVDNGHSTKVDEEEVYARSRESSRWLSERWTIPPLSPRWHPIA